MVENDQEEVVRAESREICFNKCTQQLVVNEEIKLFI
jgi:hypothetical protein